MSPFIKAVTAAASVYQPPLLVYSSSLWVEKMQQRMAAAPAFTYHLHANISSERAGGAAGITLTCIPTPMPACLQVGMQRYSTGQPTHLNATTYVCMLQGGQKEIQQRTAANLAHYLHVCTSPCGQEQIQKRTGGDTAEDSCNS
jgi:hypothetical protein